MQRRRKVNGRLTAKLHDDALGLFLIDDIQHIFRRQRLKVEPIGNIKIGADRFRVVVDDDGFYAHLPQGPDGMNGAIVKFHALPDPNGAGAEHDHLAP